LQLQNEAADNRQTEQQRAVEEMAVCQLFGKSVRQQVHEQGARRHAEQGDGHRHEREVIPHGHTEDPRQQVSYVSVLRVVKNKPP